MSGANKNFPKLSRSFSLPNSEDFSRRKDDSSPRSNWGLQTRRKSRSLSRVDDQSNSAAPVRRQPHPFALQALGFRPMFGGRGPRLPEWPPPDPPPLTPLNIGLGRNLLSPPQGTNPPQLWPPRPWWRRAGQNRATNAVVHVALDTADTTVPPPNRLIERPARIGWTSTSEEAEVDHETVATTDTASPEPQHASLIEVDESVNRGELNTSVVTTDLQPIVMTHMPITVAATTEETRIQTTQSAGPTDDAGLISLNSEEVQEESTFQIFIVVDTNPGFHETTMFGEAREGVNTNFMERFMQQVANNYFTTIGESGLEVHSLNESGSSYEH